MICQQNHEAAAVKETPTTSERKKVVQSTPSTSTMKRNAAVKVVTPKNEILEEPDIIPLEQSSPLFQRANFSPQFDISSLSASSVNCNFILKNMHAYVTHRNYVQGQAY
uniref:Uncharacterized protein n=1 Tax=Panagrolaimus sp. ES5 TaxID=591445 RepID=A0AC34FH96_9BILA